MEKNNNLSATVNVFLIYFIFVFSLWGVLDIDWLSKSLPTGPEVINFYSEAVKSPTKAKSVPVHIFFPSKEVRSSSYNCIHGKSHLHLQVRTVRRRQRGSTITALRPGGKNTGSTISGYESTKSSVSSSSHQGRKTVNKNCKTGSKTPEEKRVLMRCWNCLKQWTSFISPIMFDFTHIAWCQQGSEKVWRQVWTASRPWVC